MVTTTAGGGGGRKSGETVHRVTFVECNNTEHGPPSSEDTENESYTVIKTTTKKITTSSIVKPSHQNDSKHNGELQPLMVNSSEFTDSGYTDSIISGHDSTMHSSSPHADGDIMDADSPALSAASGSPNKEILKPVLRLTRARR